MEEKKGQWKEKTLNLRDSAEEHKAIKKAALEKDVTIKELIFQALDKFIPSWREKK